MKKQEVIKQIEELIAIKKELLEGDELDWVYKHDIQVLKNALKVIKGESK